MRPWTRRRRADRAGPDRLGYVQDVVAHRDVVGLERELLLEGVRLSAQTEERRRVARELHDGVGQRIVALGYLADDVACLAAGSAAEEGLVTLREEITGIARDLRSSVLDLREEPETRAGLVDALAAYARAAGQRTGVQVHLRLDGIARPSRSVERELLAIGQEAVANALQHAGGSHLWVTLVQDGPRLRLSVEDDGVGGATPRSGHCGLEGMRERAVRIGARLEVADRPGGGTAVTLVRATAHPVREGGVGDDHERLARR